MCRRIVYECGEFIYGTAVFFVLLAGDWVSMLVYLLGQFAGTSEQERIFDCRTLLLTAKIFKKLK